MKLVINPHNLKPDENWTHFRKVRAVIENTSGDFAISIEGGKCIFPGGKCEKDEPPLMAIMRELKEEMGISFEPCDFYELFELETIYDDFFDYRTQSIKPRHTITTYYYIQTNKSIDVDSMNLTEGEKKQNFRVSFVNKSDLLTMLNEDHSNLENGRFFDEENQVVVERVLKK